MTIFTSGSKALGVLRSMAVVLALTVPGLAVAAVPSTLAVHGGLFSVGGGPVADGNYDVTFSLYAGASGGSAVFSEGPVTVAVKGGFYHHVLGAKTPVDPAVFGALSTPFMAVRIGSDPEFPRQALSSVPFAIRGIVADALDCSGCIKAAQLDAGVLSPYAKAADLAKVAASGAYADLVGAPDLTQYAKSAALAKVATSGAYADLSGVPDLSVYAKAAALAKFAVSGAYADLTGVPDLSVYAKAAALAKVATTGKYADLAGTPETMLAPGAACDEGFVAAGVLEDGTLDCVAIEAGDITLDMLPADGISQVSNGALNNIVVDTLYGTPNVAIPDNSPVGVVDSITVANLGSVKSITVSVELTNSDISKLAVTLYDPAGNEYSLHSKSGSGTSLKTSWPAPTKLLKGDLATWNGKSPAGKWYLKVVDSGLLNNNADGSVKSWSLAFQVLSNSRVDVAGNLTITGNLKISGATAAAAYEGGMPSAPYRWAYWSTYTPSAGWADGNNPDLFGGVHPSEWGDGAAKASQISADKSVQLALFNKRGYGFKNVRIVSEYWRCNTSTTSKHVGVLFRIKNTTGSAINWTPRFAYTSYQGWGEVASVALNGSLIWNASDCTNGCQSDITLAIPPNRTSTAIFVSSSGNEWNRSRALFAGFSNDSLALPNGLQFIDDLETATGGYEQ